MPYASPFNAGSEIKVLPFRSASPLVVEIQSDASFDCGGSARVFEGLVKDADPPRAVALKVMSSAVPEHRSELICRELSVAANLAAQSMQRILPFIGRAFVGSHVIIVTAYMKNGNMMQYFQNQPTVDRQKLIVQVAEAVSWLHESNNLVHGDLKGENVLIDDDGDAVLADFGLSTLIEREASGVTCTAIRDMSTLRFAAPELLDFLEGPERVMRTRSKTTQTDVYAFGMLTVQAFSGRHPWPNLGSFGVIMVVLTGHTHPRPSEDVTQLGLTDSWWGVCQHCWRYEPARRPTMHQVWNSLQGYWREDKAAEQYSRETIMPGLYWSERPGPPNHFSTGSNWPTLAATTDSADPTSGMIPQQRVCPPVPSQLPPPYLPAAQLLHPSQNPSGGPVWRGKISWISGGSLVTVVQVVASDSCGDLCYDAWPAQLTLTLSEKRFTQEELGSWAKRNTPALCVVAAMPNIAGAKDEARFKTFAALLASKSTVAVSHIPVPSTVHGIQLVFFPILPNLACAAFIDRPAPEISDNPPPPTAPVLN